MKSEVKPPKKPIIVYYLIVLVVILLIHLIQTVCFKEKDEVKQA